VNRNSVPDLLKLLWIEKELEEENSLKGIREKLKAKQCNPSNQNLSMALKSCSFLTRKGKRGNYTYIQTEPSEEITLTENIFPRSLLESLQNQFGAEIFDLKLNYGKSGNCTAFTLRKILEKIIFLVFAKNGIVDKLKNGDGDFVGLKTMVNLATSYSSKSGKPFMMPKTGKAINGIKFLGDTSAHNPLTEVDMETIVPSMPYIITAYKELSKSL